jgi:hypothetical protein
VVAVREAHIPAHPNWRIDMFSSNRYRTLPPPDLPLKLQQSLARSVTLRHDASASSAVIVGVAHISERSVREVQEVIAAARPSAVLLELCPARRAILDAPQGAPAPLPELTCVDRMLLFVRSPTARCRPAANTDLCVCRARLPGGRRSWRRRACGRARCSRRSSG